MTTRCEARETREVSRRSRAGRRAAVLIVAALLTAACQRPPASGRATDPSRVARTAARGNDDGGASTAARAPSRDTAAQRPARADTDRADAGGTPPASGTVGWERVRVDDAYEGESATWHVLTARRPGERPVRVFAVREFERCSDATDPALRVYERPDEGVAAETMRTVAALRCGRSNHEGFALVRRETGALALVRFDCSTAGNGCSTMQLSAADAVTFVDESIDLRPFASLRGVPLSTSADPLVVPDPARADAPAPADLVRVRVDFGPEMGSLESVEEMGSSLSLVVEGAVNRRIEFGPSGSCSDGYGPRPRNAVLRVHCYAAAFGNFHLVVSRVGAALRVAFQSYGEFDRAPRPSTIVVRLPAGARVEAGELPF